jgi:hypothetical protein
VANIDNVRFIISNMLKAKDEGGYMKKWVSVATVGILIVLIGCTTAQCAQEAPRISKDELKAKLGSPDVVLIDVRTGSDWEKSDEKITGAVRMDPAAVDTWAATLPMGREIILYCA